MTQPTSLAATKTEGWWGAPEPIVTLPVIVASVCGHTTSGITVSANTSTIPDAHDTHCSRCMPATAPSTSSDPVASIPTVVGSVCQHALSGFRTPIGPTTILAAATALCASCADFAQIAEKTASCYTIWRETESESLSMYYAATQLFGRSIVRSLPSRLVRNTPIYQEYLSRRKTLARQYEQSRLTYERAVCYHQENSNSALPVVNKHGVALLPSLAYENEPAVRPRKKQSTPFRVRFEEDKEHPSQETSRRKEKFYRKRNLRHGKASVYEPGRWADKTGDGWEDTSKPVLYKDKGHSPDDMYMRSLGFEERSWWQNEPNPIGEGSNGDRETAIYQPYDTAQSAEGSRTTTGRSVSPHQGSKIDSLSDAQDVQDALQDYFDLVSATISGNLQSDQRCEVDMVSDAQDVQEALQDYFDFVSSAVHRNSQRPSGIPLPIPYTQWSPPAQPQRIRRDPVWMLPESEK